MANFNILQDYKNGKFLLTGNVPFSELYNKVRYTYRVNPNIDPYDNEFMDSVTDYTDLSNEEYQRRIDMIRVKAIKRFILDQIVHFYKKDGEISVIFPTSMILAVEKDDTSNKDIDLTDCLVVDGQHRLYSMSSLYEDVNNSLFISTEIPNSKIKEFIEQYMFNITLLVNFDIYEQAQIFATVNFNQKKVNKSLYYDIYGFYFGEKGQKYNELYLAHKLVVSLNSMSISPLRGYIKILGNGKGFVSQAFMVEALLQHFSRRGIWYQRVTQDFNEGRTDFRYVTNELIAYYSAIRDIFVDSWPKDVEDKDKSIICKTTGMGALCMLLGCIHNLILDHYGVAEFGYEYNENLKKLYEDKLSILKTYEKELFSLNGDFAGTGGRGLQVNLYKRMKDLIFK